MIIRFTPLEIQPATHPLRNNYLNSLPEAQELFLELQIAGGTAIDILVDEVLHGYAIINAGAHLLEYYLTPSVTPYAEV